jgi:hypothetical protein
MGAICWPDGKQFAFTIVDDTDFSCVRNTKPVYDLLRDCGIRTTKTVWPFRPLNESTSGGTLEDQDYRDWVLDMQKHGFEIALHGIADGSSDRPRILAGLDYFRSVIGSGPTIHTNHVRQAEGIYWGPRRLDGPLRSLYQAYRRCRSALQYEGAISGSPYFWGDLCRSQIKYVRNFVFNNEHSAASSRKRIRTASRLKEARVWSTRTSRWDSIPSRRSSAV